MKLRSLAAVSLLFALLAPAAHPNVQESAEGYSYRIAGRGWIQVAGVCNADPQQITCWKPTGEPDPKLSELLNAYYLVNPQQRLEIRYKHRSLMLIMRSMLGQSSGAGNVNFNGLEVDPGGMLFQQGSIGYGGQGEETTNFFWYYPPEGLATVDATLQLGTSTEPVKLALKVDAMAKFPGGVFQITKIEKGTTQPEPNSRALAKAPRWEVSYNLLGQGPEPITSVFVTVFDRDGNAINQVDDRGNPVQPSPGQFMYDGFRPNRPVVMVNAGRIILGVNPEKVGSMSVTGTGQRKVTFKNVSLASSGSTTKLAG